MLTCTERIVELGVVIGKNGRDISASEADSYIAGYSEFKRYAATAVGSS